MNSKFIKNSRRSLLVLVSAITWAVALLVHSISARAYFSSNSIQLAIVAEMAVRAGRDFLPNEPHAAVYAADRYVLSHGVAAEEIVFTSTDSDNSVLTLRLCRRVPRYMALFAVGLPNRTIILTATARRRSDYHKAGLQRVAVVELGD
jgi:hypothetical protein